MRAWSAALDQRLKSRVGKAAYAGPLLGALIRPVDTLNVTIDGRHRTASWAVIANARHYGGHFVLAPRTGILQRGLEAILFKTRSRAVLLGQLMSLAAGRLEPRAVARRRRRDAAPARGRPSRRITRCRSRSTATCSAPRRSRWMPAPRELRLIVPTAASGSSNSAR